MFIGLFVLAVLAVIGFFVFVLVTRPTVGRDIAPLDKMASSVERNLRRSEGHLLERISNAYIEMYRQMGDPTPESTIREMVREALKRASHQTPSLSGEGAGQQLLRLAAQSPELQHYIKACREDGVRDEDFEVWWSMHEYERQMVILADEQFSVHAMVAETGRLGERERAADSVLRSRVFYRSPLAPPAPEEPQGEDRHLPYELKDRVNRWIEKQMRQPGSLFPQESSSANAYIRHLVRKGEV